MSTDDPSGVAVLPQGYVLGLARPSDSAGDREEEEEPVHGDFDEDDDDDDQEPCQCSRCRADMESEEEDSEDDDDELYDSEDDDDEFYDSDDQERDRDVDVPLKIDATDKKAEVSGSLPLNPLLRRRDALPGRRFLGTAPWFASMVNTAGFLRVAVVERPTDRPATDSKEQQGGRRILVLYRYTQFSAVSGGVEVCGGTKLHDLRFTVPPAGDVTGSLPWVWSTLVPVMYPTLHSRALQALWSKLVSDVFVPPEATCVQVIADVGILRRENYKRRRMEHVCAALEGMMTEPWLGYHVAMELRLPEPVRVQCADEAEDTECERPAKRRKVVAEEVAGQECPVCFDDLDSDIVVWPGCTLPHVFHGACLERTLTESEMCPLCRRRLSAPKGQV